MEILRKVIDRMRLMTPEEQEKLLSSLISPQEIVMRSEGTFMKISTLGLRIFETKSLLSEAGIADSDPRASVYHGIVGSLIDKQITDKLASISARKETAAVNAGAIQGWEQGARVWWVPNSAIENFMNEMQVLQNEYSQVVQDIYNDYETIRYEAARRVENAAEKAWEEMSYNGTADISEDMFVDQALELFNKRFVGKSELFDRIRIEVRPIRKSLPPVFDAIMDEVKQDNKYISEDEKRYAASQLRISQIQEAFLEEDLGNEVRARQIKREIEMQQYQDNLDMYQEIQLNIQAKILTLADEIVAAASANKKIAPSTFRSWRQRIGQLEELSPNNPSLGKTLEIMHSMASDDTPITRDDIAVLGKRVFRALDDLNEKTNIEIDANEIFYLANARGGSGNEALARVNSIRKNLTRKLDEVDAMSEMIVNCFSNETTEITA